MLEKYVFLWKFRLDIKEYKSKRMSKLKQWFLRNCNCRKPKVHQHARLDRNFFRRFVVTI